MSRRAPKLIIEIHDDRVDLFFDAKKITEVWIDKGGNPHTTPLRNVEVIDSSPIGPSQRQLITVQTLVTKRDFVGLPRLLQDRGAEQDTSYAPTRPRKMHADAADSDSIDKHTAERVLDAVLKSCVMHPEMTSKISGLETKRIAQELDVLPMAVAGVKAALTRGVYGDKDDLIAKYRRRAITESNTSIASMGRRPPSA